MESSYSLPKLSVKVARAAFQSAALPAELPGQSGERVFEHTECAPSTSAPAARQLRDIVRLYIDAGRATRAPRTTQDYLDFLKAELRGPVGDLLTPVHRVTLRQHLSELATKAPVHANRLWALVRASLRWAVNEGMMATTGVEGFRRPGGRELPRDRVLSDHELTVLLHNTSGRPQLFLWLSLLTGQRTGEVLAMQWDHIDLRDRLWRLPAAMRKDRRSHAVPLVGQAVALLHHACPVSRGFVFRGLRANPGRLAQRIRQAAPGVIGWRLYDTRRTVATGLARFGAEPFLVERVLGHALPGVAATYNRHGYIGEMREALRKWEAHLVGLSG